MCGNEIAPTRVAGGVLVCQGKSMEKLKNRRTN
jgi:hypothetical protein